MSNHHPSLGYEVVMTTRGRVARITCAQCPAHDEQKISGAHNPEAVVKQFRARGWKADIQTASKARCPACVASKPRHDPEALIRNLVPPAADQHQQEEPMTTAAPPSKTALTVDDKRRVRHLLDANFDDQAGCYLAGYSDEKVGSELSLPWALVAEYRDQTYGPLKVDPEVQAIRAMVGEVEQAMQRLRKDTDAAVAKVRQDIEAINARLAAFAKKKAAA